MSNVLKMPVQNSIQNLAAHGWSARRIARELGLNRRTVSRYLIAASKCTTPDSEVTTGSGHLPELADPVSDPKCTTPGNEVTTGSGHLPELADPASGSKCTTPGNEVTTGSGQEILPSSGPAPAVAAAVAPAAVAATASRSKCGAFREVIVPLFEKGLTAQRIYQDLRVEHAFTGAYESVKRFLAGLRAAAPVPVHRVEAQPGEEMQVDFGLGAPVVGEAGKARRTWVFRSVLSHSRKGYSESVFHQDTETFLRVIENSLRHYGGVPLILNLDNLKAAVIKPDWVDPELNPKIIAFCQHYGLHLLPCRPRTPQHKGKVERGVAYVKSNALKGLRFSSLAAQNAHLLQWEKTVADTRLHGTTRRQVSGAFELEKPHLQPLPPSLFACYRESLRRVARDSSVQVDRAYYQVPLEHIGRDVWVQIESRSVRIFNQRRELIASHLPLAPGRFSSVQGVGGFDSKGIGARQAAGQWLLLASKYGPHAKAWAEAVWSARGIEGVRSLMGLAGLGRNHSSHAIEQACARAHNLSAHRLSDIQRLLKQGSAATPIQELLPWPDPTATPITPTPTPTSTSTPTPTPTPSNMNLTNLSSLTHQGVIRDLQTYSQFIQTHTARPPGAP
jgi:transposase